MSILDTLHLSTRLVKSLFSKGAKHKVTFRKKDGSVREMTCLYRWEESKQIKEALAKVPDGGTVHLEPLKESVLSDILLKQVIAVNEILPDGTEQVRSFRLDSVLEWVSPDGVTDKLDN